MIDAIKSAAGPLFGGFAALVIDGTTMVPMGCAAGVILTIVSMTRRWTLFEAKLEDQANRLHRIEKLLETRPCVNGQCDLKSDTK